MGSFGLDNRGVLLYTSTANVDLNAVAIHSNGEITHLAPLKRPGQSQMSVLDCKMIAGLPSCIIITNNNFIIDLVLSFDGASNELLIATSQIHKLYQDYQITSWNYNDGYLVTRAGNGSSEVMLVYKRSTSGSNNVWWGLTSDAYYNVEGATETSSTPIVFRDEDGKTVIKFSQNQQTGIADRTDLSFKGFKPSASLLVLGSDVNQNEAKQGEIVFDHPNLQARAFPISQFFSSSPTPKPNPGDNNGSNSAWIWVLSILVVLLLILVGVLATKLSNAIHRKNESEVSSSYQNADKLTLGPDDEEDTQEEEKFQASA